MRSPRRFHHNVRRYGVTRSLAALKWQLELPTHTPFQERLSLLHHGFTPLDYSLYDFKRYGYDAYLPDLAAGAAQGRRINGAFAVALMGDKLLSHAMLAPHIELPEILGLAERGQLYPITPAGTVRDVASLLRRSEQGAVILKPSRGRKGERVYILEFRGGAPHLSGVPKTLAELDAFVGTLDDYLIEARVEQAAYAATIFPDSTHTLRLVTMRDVQNDHAPFLAAAVHRFGTQATVPTDNWTRGGLSASVDSSGYLSPAAYRLGDAKVGWSSTHPDTGERIEGVQVPHWSELEAQVLELVRRFDFLNIVGWDLVVTESGSCLIEGNTALVGTRALQVHHPLLQDDRVRRFYEHYGVI